MPNMSYCRFRNTRTDVDDCLEALKNDDLNSSEEISAAKEMIKNILEFCEEVGIIDGFDEDTLDSHIDDCYSREEE